MKRGIKRGGEICGHLSGGGVHFHGREVKLKIIQIPKFNLKLKLDI